MFVWMGIKAQLSPTWAEFVEYSLIILPVFVGNICIWIVIWISVCLRYHQFQISIHDKNRNDLVSVEFFNKTFSRKSLVVWNHLNPNFSLKRPQGGSGQSVLKLGMFFGLEFHLLFACIHRVLGHKISTETTWPNARVNSKLKSVFREGYLAIGCPEKTFPNIQENKHFGTRLRRCSRSAFKRSTANNVSDHYKHHYFPFLPSLAQTKGSWS